MQRKQFRIGELAQHLGVERFVVRFWEREFGLRPTRSEGGQRFYEERDLDRFQKIRSLLYEQKLTIAGAKKIIASPSESLASTPEQLKVQLQDLRRQLVELQQKL